jgi:hypothetical protein
MNPQTYETVPVRDHAALARMQRLRAAAAAYGAVLEEVLPEGPDKTFTIRQHRTTAMWAIVAVTRLPDGTPRPAHTPTPSDLIA